MASGIYKIQSEIKPERIYIGSAVNLKSRRRQHFSDLRLNKHHNSKLQHHVNKYGLSDLKFSVVIICDKNELKPINNIVRPEQFFIWAYDPWFNISPIAGSSLGIKRSEQFIEKMRGRKVSEETRQKMRKPMSEEARRNLSKAKTGLKLKPLTQEHKDKIGRANKGKKRTPEMIDNFIKMMTGRKQLPDEIERRRKSLIGKKRTEETKKRLSEAQLNLSPEKKLKIKMAKRVLSHEIIEQIKLRYNNKERTQETDMDIANSFGVSINSVRNIVHGKTYKDY
jgi:group I intron endonuclease